jgi:xylulokinase
MALYLGFDSSTQSLTATVVEITPAVRRVVAEHVVIFDEALPEYGTSRGVITSGDGRTVTAPPAMWAAALDLMMARLRASGMDLSSVRAISGAAQQHGSVYLAAGAARAFAALDPARTLVDQIGGLFSRDQSPVWLDCSTTNECGALTAAAGGPRELARLTGSRAYERFTAAQIRRFAERDPDAYARTERVHLVSSFMASLLIGADAPIDPGDGSGMNLMDIGARQWSTSAVGATAPDLAGKLPPLRESWTVAGELSPYWRSRYGFGPAQVIAWSGDNPSSLIGLGLIEAGQLGISLGTSDTVFGPTGNPAPDPEGAGHVFGSPAGGYMALTCFANGSLARERVRDLYGLGWPEFSALLRATPPGNGGALMVPWFVPEITPTVDAPGPHRFDLNATDAAKNVRAVVEGQAMAMRLHSRWIAPSVRVIRATGGAAQNAEILQVIADVFGADVVRIAPPNAASLGAALRAFHGERLAAGAAVSWTEVIAGFTDPDTSAPAVRPHAAHVAVYERLLPAYQTFAAQVQAARRA